MLAIADNDAPSTADWYRSTAATAMMQDAQATKHGLAAGEVITRGTVAYHAARRKEN